MKKTPIFPKEIPYAIFEDNQDFYERNFRLRFNNSTTVVLLGRKERNNDAVLKR